MIRSSSLAPSLAPSDEVHLVDEGIAASGLDLHHDRIDAAVGRGQPRDLFVVTAGGTAEQHAGEQHALPPAHRGGRMRMRPSTAGAMVPAAATAFSRISAASGALSASTTTCPSRNAVIPSPPLAT